MESPYVDSDLDSNDGKTRKTHSHPQGENGETEGVSQVAPPNPITTRRSKSHSTTPKSLKYEYADSDDDEDVASMFSLFEEEEPHSFQSAMTYSDAPIWMASMKREYYELFSNKCWEIVPLRAENRSILFRWVHKIKPSTRSTPIIYKSRLMAKGFRQIFWSEYLETLSTVLLLSGLRCLLSINVDHNMEIHSMDVKNAFLNGKL